MIAEFKTATPFLIIWNDNTRDKLVHADQIDRPDADETTFVFWRDRVPVLIAPDVSVHHVEILTEVEVENLAEDARLKAAAEQALREAIQAHVDQQCGCGERVGTTEDEPSGTDPSEVPKVEPCPRCHFVGEHSLLCYDDKVKAYAVDLTGVPAA